MHRPDLFEQLAHERQQRLMNEARANRQFRAAQPSQQDVVYRQRSLAARLASLLRFRPAAPSQS
jgi:hypothetical protein